MTPPFIKGAKIILLPKLKNLFSHDYYYLDCRLFHKLQGADATLLFIKKPSVFAR
jgi:hypothetical protein